MIFSRRFSKPPSGSSQRRTGGAAPVSRRSSRRLATGELVAAVGNLPHLDNSGQPQAILFEETYVCLARKQNKLFTMADNRAIFDEARHVHVASKASGHVLVEEALQKQGIRRKITLEIAHFAILSHVLARSDLYLVPSSRCDALQAVYENLESCPIPAAVPSYHVSLHWHENDRSNLANQWFRNLVRTALTNLG
jgi:DNA-binding transcriptional LysR family regulator